MKSLLCELFLLLYHVSFTLYSPLFLPSPSSLCYPYLPTLFPICVLPMFPYSMPLFFSVPSSFLRCSPPVPFCSSFVPLLFSLCSPSVPLCSSSVPPLFLLYSPSVVPLFPSVPPLFPSVPPLFLLCSRPLFPLFPPLFCVTPLFPNFEPLFFSVPSLFPLV